MNRNRKLAVAMAAVAVLTGLSQQPAHADPAAAGHISVNFSGHCRHNSVTWVAYKVQPVTSTDVVIAVNGAPRARSTFVLVGFGSRHASFAKDGVAKTVSVSEDGVVVAEHTYRCGAV